MREISEQIPVRGNVSWDWSSQFRGLARVLGAILFFTLLPSAVGAVPSVTLAWSPSADTNVIGYNIYYGRASRTYTNKVDVGNVLTATVSNLVEGTTYYFAATAYNIIGMESTFSGEVTYSVPATALARP
jgi:hypothetical protein